MKKISSIFIAFLLFVFFVSLSKAAGSYTLEEVATHASSTDCWMVIDRNVYDLTAYLSKHDREFDIRSWCGTDASADYSTKAGRGKDHSLKADKLLTEYMIGSLDAAAAGTATTGTTMAGTTATSKTVVANSNNQNKYNVFLPLLATLLLYLMSIRFLAKPKHDFIWNSVMLVGLIPSFAFGMLMAMGFAASSLLYLHVELSIIFGTACILHFLYRLKIYLSEGRFTFQKKR